MPPVDPRRRALAVSASLAAAAAFLGLAWWLFDFTIDDTFISMRYSRNLAAGQGLVFNPGERDWAYTNPAWVGLGAGVAALGLDPVTGVKVAGVALTLVNGFLVYLGALALGAGRDAAAGVAVYLLAPSTVIWAVGGLETPLYTTFFLLLLWPGEGALARARPLAAFGLATTRAEGAAVAVAAACAALASGARPTRRDLRGFGVAAAAVAAVYAGHWWYFGTPVPNSYLMKFLGASPGEAFRLRDLLRRPAVPWTLHLVLPLAAAAVGAARGPARPAAAATGAAGAVFLIALATWDWMPGYRYYAPLTALVATWGAAGAARLARGLETEGEARPAAGAAALAVLAGLVFLPLTRDLAGAARYARRYAASQAGAYLPTAAWLRRNLPPGATVAMARIGAIPYRSGLRTIGLDGLIHRRFITGGLAPAYVLSRAPEAVVLLARTAGAEPPTADPKLRPLQLDPGFRREYRLAARFGDPRFAALDSGVFLVYTRRARPPAPEADGPGPDGPG